MCQTIRHWPNPGRWRRPFSTIWGRHSATIRAIGAAPATPKRTGFLSAAFQSCRTRKWCCAGSAVLSPRTWRCIYHTGRRGRRQIRILGMCRPIAGPPETCCRPPKTVGWFRVLRLSRVHPDAQTIRESVFPVIPCACGRTNQTTD